MYEKSRLDRLLGVRASHRIVVRATQVITLTTISTELPKTSFYSKFSSTPRKSLMIHTTRHPTTTLNSSTRPAPK